MDVFKVEFFVKDQHLATVQRKLDGLVFDFTAIPVKNTKKKGGKVVAANEGGANAVLLEGLRLGTTISTKEARQKLIKAGFADKRVYGTIHGLVKMKILRRVKPGIYKVAKLSAHT